MPEPPDLQALVQQYSGYDRIPPKAWDLYAAQLATVREWLASRHTVLTPQIPRRSWTVYLAENRKDGLAAAHRDFGQPIEVKRP
jgi:hypothetical protein